MLYYCYINDFDFFKDEKGYFTYIENKKWYINKVGEDNNIDNYIKPTIATTGQLVYQIGTFFHINEDLNINLIFKRGEVENIYKTKYIKPSSLNQKSGELGVCGGGIYDGYYVLSIRSFEMERDNALDSLYKYAEEGSKLKGTSNFIVDNRGNGGGGDIYLTDFYENYTGESLKLNIAKTVRFSRIVNQHDNYLGSRTEKQDGTYSYNENLFVYLIDKDTASAGERGVLSIRQMDNALLVGTNSRGCIIGGGRYYKLPISKIVVTIGDCAFIEGNCTAEIEGLGWMPDIYVDGYLALDRTIKMYEYYGLNPDENVSKLDKWGRIIPTFE